MRSRWPLRLSGAAVGAALALAPASFALGAPTHASTVQVPAVTKRLPAHDVPGDGFNAVLAADDHNSSAGNASDEAACAGSPVSSPLGTGKDVSGLLGTGKDVWLFGAPTGAGFEAIQLIFLNPGDGLEVDVTIPSGEYGTYVGTGDDKHHAAIAVPTGWLLVDGDAKLTGTNEASETLRFAVEATCVAQPPATPTQGTSASPGGTGGGDLPITGTAIGAIVLIGFGLLASGVALMAVRRRREIDLTEQF